MKRESIHQSKGKVTIVTLLVPILLLAGAGFIASAVLASAQNASPGRAETSVPVRV